MNRGGALAATDSLYEAALDASKWPTALRSVAEVVGATACGVRFESFISPGVTQTWVGLEPEWERAYVEHYYPDDIWANVARDGSPGTFAASESFLDPNIRKRNPFINELCAAFEIDDLVGGLLSLTPARMVSFAAMKPRGKRPYDDEHAAILRAISPHVKRAIQIEEALRDAREGERTAWSLVDRLPVGAIVFDASRRVVHQNTAATAMIAAGVAVDGRAMRELLTTLRPCPIAVLGKVFAAVALRLPPEETTFGLANAVGRTLVLLTDPTKKTLPPAELLMNIYGLTLAESRVALLVGGGLAPKEAANELGTAWNTVRAQLRHVFAKTRTSGQPALVRLLVQLGLTSV